MTNYENREHAVISNNCKSVVTITISLKTTYMDTKNTNEKHWFI